MRTRPRESTYSRHWKILGFILTSTAGKSLQQIHHSLEEMGENVHERTVRRDLMALQEAGFPINMEKNDSGTTFYRIVPTFRDLPPIPLQPLDIVALLASKAVLADRGNSVLGGQLQELLNRLRAVSSHQLRQFIGQLEASLYCRPMSAAGGAGASVPESFVDVLARAAHSKKYVRISYRNAQGHESKNRQVAPLLLWFHEQQMYMVAHCRRNRDRRVFALARISDVQPTAEGFEGDGDFDPQKFVSESFGVFHADPVDVLLEFDAVLRHYFDMHPIHPTQTISKSNGRHRLRLKVGISEPLVHRLAGFGCRVTVIDPPALRDLVIARHRDALAAYETDPARGAATQPSLDLVFE